MSNSVTHFEIFAEDLAGLAQFYRDLFGWRIEKAAGVDYFRIQTGSADDKTVNGGMMHRPIEGPKSWVHYVQVEALDESIERVKSLGGRLIRVKAAVPKTAWYAVVEDPEGNIFAMWQPDPTAFPPPEPDI